MLLPLFYWYGLLYIFIQNNAIYYRNNYLFFYHIDCGSGFFPRYRPLLPFGFEKTGFFDEGNPTKTAGKNR